MTRSGLNWLGDPLENSGHKAPPAHSTGWPAFRILLVMTIAVYALTIFLVIIITEASPNYYSNDPSQPVASTDTLIWLILKYSLRQVWMTFQGIYYFGDTNPPVASTDTPIWVIATDSLRQFLIRLFVIYFVVITIKTCRVFRRRHGSPGVLFEDYFLIVFNRWCIVAQMLHHTADYSHQKAACCTETGLAHDQHIV